MTVWVALTLSLMGQAASSYGETAPDGGVAEEQTEVSAPESSPDAGTPAPAIAAVSDDKAARGRTLFRGAVEVTAFSLPSGTPGGAQDLYANVLPLLSIDTGDAFGFELGATLRFRVFDDPPAQRDGDYGWLRGADWDERSDFGQVLRDLWIGSEDSAARLRAGPLGRYSLGRGLLVNRYSNQLNPDYHPAGAVFAADLGSVHAEGIAGDVLAPRLFALAVTGDIAGFLGASGDALGRYHLVLSAAQDFGLAGTQTPGISLLVVEADAAIFKEDFLQAFVYGALGSRLFEADYALGALLGLSLDADLGDARVGAKLEGRKVGSSFRFGMFGPAYELSRFSDVGFSEPGTAAARLPDTWAGYVEVQSEFGNAEDLGLAKRGAFVISASAEAFAFGRIDVDAAISARVARDVATITGRFTAVGLNENPRYQGGAEVRWRFAPSFYAIAQGGVVFFPQPDLTLVRGFYGGVGVGADFSN